MAKEEKKEETNNEEVEETEEYLSEYKSGPTVSKTGQGNVYNITIQIGQPPNPDPPKK